MINIDVYNICIHIYIKYTHTHINMYMQVFIYIQYIHYTVYNVAVHQHDRGRQINDTALTKNNNKSSKNI